MANVIELQLIVDDKGTPTIKSFSKGSERSVSSLARTISQKAGGAMRKFGRLAGTTMKKISRMVFSLKSAFIGLAVYGLARVISGFEKLSGVQEQAEAGMMAAMKSMGRYTKGFEDLIKKTASGIQTQSTFGDEAVLVGTKFLMTYGNISNKAMPRVMKAMTDLSALMKGDFTSAANMLGKASMGMVGELRKAGITVDSDTYKLEGFMGVLKQIEAQVRGQAKALRETEAGGLKAFGNVVGDVKEKFGLFTSTVKGKIARVLLPHVEKLNEKLAEWIGSGQAERDAERWADTIINAVKKVLKFIDNAKKPLSEFFEFFSDPGSSFKRFLNRWDDLGDKILKATRYIQDLDRWMKGLPRMSEIFGGGTAGKPSGAGGGFPLSAEMERAMQTAKGRFGARPEKVLTDFGTPTPFAAGGPENKALEIGLEERLAMLTGHHVGALAIQQAQQTMWLEAETAKNERLKASSAERISLDQVEHDAALALMESQRDAYFRFQEEKKRMAFQAASTLVGLLEFLGQKNKLAAQAALALNTALSIAQAIQNTAVASTRALAELGPIAGPPAAATIAAWGKVQIGLIAAAGALKFASAGGGGGTGAPTPVSIGTPSTRINAGGGQEARINMRIIIYGDFYGEEAFIDRLAEKLSYAVENRHIRVVSSEVV